MSDTLTVFSPIRWWQALNPAIYLISILPGFAVWLLAGPELHVFALICSTAAVALLQHAINVLNDAKDWQLGADVNKYDSWVRFHDHCPDTTFKHGCISFAVGALIGLIVLIMSDQLWIIGYALPFVLVGLLYNVGKRPLSYTVWGEWVTGLCYGPGVFGGLWFVSGMPFSGLALLGMLAFASLSMALLFSHQPPQIETDRAAGKYSFAVRHGPDQTYQYAQRLFILSLVSMTIALWAFDNKTILAIIYSISGLTASIWILRLIPNPKRLLLSATAVYGISSLFSL